jgi:hypothetical protein
VAALYDVACDVGLAIAKSISSVPSIVRRDKHYQYPPSSISSNKKKRLRNSYFDEYLRVQCVPLIRGGHDEDPDHPHLHRGWRSRTRES